MKKFLLLIVLLLVPGSTFGMKKRYKKIKRKLSKTFKKSKKDDYILKPHFGARVARRIPGIKQVHRNRLEKKVVSILEN